MVGGDIIVAASYEAKKVGIKCGMRAWEALRIVGPSGVFLRQDLSFYSKVSAQLFSFL
jgi:nucleotidyltransferase/DNA polymerase involved in DNA repair